MSFRSSWLLAVALSLGAGAAAAAAGGPPPCPPIDALVADAPRWSGDGVQEQFVTCEYLDAGEPHWPRGWIRGIWQTKGRPYAVSDLCRGVSHYGLDAAVASAGRAAFVAYAPLDDATDWAPAARALLGGLESVAIECPTTENLAAMAVEPWIAPVASPEPSFSGPTADEEQSSESEFTIVPRPNPVQVAAGVQAYQAGEGYYYGRDGKSKDHVVAFEHYARGAKLGNADCQYSLAWMYLKGEGGQKISNARAVRWALEAASRGSVWGVDFLGNRYYYGQGVPKDFAKALDHYRRAAAKDHAGSQYSLGWMLEKGEGTARDLAQAIRWYQASARQGNKNAQEQLQKLGKSW